MHDTVCVYISRPLNAIGGHPCCRWILTLCETCFASGGLTQDCRAAHTQHDCLSMAEHRRDLVASCKTITMVDNPKLKPPQTLTGKTQTPGDLCVCVCVQKAYLDILHPWSKSWDSEQDASSCASSSPPQGMGATSLLRATRFKEMRK